MSNQMPEVVSADIMRIVRTIVRQEFADEEDINELRQAVKSLPLQNREPTYKKVGTAGFMPGTEGFTMCCFKSAEVPEGTPLYIGKQCEPLKEKEIVDMFSFTRYEKQFVLNVVKRVEEYHGIR